ncbi:histidine phosphatase family protein [Xylanimonas sp. McL0601]|uniref:histidine phosphatase family protein n=1 Tax=Xylanimonas sp. McL0601 TaxID=3414739 RepID=UPI003CE716D3
MKIALIRHGQTDWNIQRRYQGRLGLDLNEVGRLQAAEAAETLRSAGRETESTWTWLASSTAERAVRTAQIVGAAVGLAPSLEVEDLIERGFGVAEGMLIDEARTRWPDRAYPGGESVDDVLTRALAAVDAIASANVGADGVIVSHGTVIRLVVGHVTGVDPGSLLNGSLTVLEGQPGDWRVVVHPVARHC